MTIVILGSLTGTVLGWLMGFLSLFLIMLILVQRGKGGGLTGALGGPGGQSAFGSKAGDTFTVITIVVASLWGFTCALTMLILGTDPVTPIVANDTNIIAGPGDEEAAEDAGISSRLPGSPSGGLSNGLSSGDADSGSDLPGVETPPVELTPQQPAGDTAAPGEGDAADDPPADASSDASAEDSADEGQGGN